ncbi:MAG: N-acetylneuraminate synthase family protein [Nitrospira sp.]|nr:N-acetylneuraminate synthase family protein [Nitrospira sp.]
MKLFGRDCTREVVVVAEIGVNHEGSVDAAADLIKLAHEAGADAVKLQSYTPKRFASSADPVRQERVRKFCLDRAAHYRLAEVAERLGAQLFSSAITEDVIPLLAELFSAIKVASGDLNFEPIVRGAAATGKTVILSTGNSTVEEIEQALVWCREEIGEERLRERVALLHCVSAYPVPIEQANLLSIPFLREQFELVTGYSNHVIGTEAVLAAVALGAQIVEVHVTDRRAGRDFRDHAMSFEPPELADLIVSVRKVTSSLGERGKSLQPSEMAIRIAMRKGVVAARNLGAGTVLVREDLMYARPASEFPAADLPRLLGKRLTVPIREGELIPRAGVMDA